MELNPYTAPDAELVSPPRRAGSHEVDVELVEPLLRAQPWLRVVSAFLWLCGAGLLIATVHVARLPAPRDAGTLRIALSFTTMLYLLLAGLWTRAALHTWRCSTVVLRLKEQPSRADFHAAVKALRAFWTSMGVSMPVLLIALFTSGHLALQLALAGSPD